MLEREHWSVEACGDGSFNVVDSTEALVAVARRYDQGAAIAATPDLVRACRKAVGAVSDYEAFLPPAAAQALAEMRAALAKVGT